MRIRIIIRGSALGLTFLLLATRVQAFEPMPPIMQTLLKVFPEEEGRFVDEPFGSTAQMPADARPLFETFRVVVPTVEDIDKCLARLFTASPYFPIKKITRYDKNPGAPGLPGFRGVWCKTEDDSEVGFSIVTINQNRFLIWAKMGYYPAFGNDSINSTVRDQYARDVSQYLAGVDLKVPDNEAPKASGRGLPEWMELFLGPSRKQEFSRQSRKAFDVRSREITSWGYSGVTGIIPTSATIDRIVHEAPDTLWFDQRLPFIQDDFEIVADGAYGSGANVPLSKELLERSIDGTEFAFAVDRFGRCRVFTNSSGEGMVHKSPQLLFPAAPVLAAGGLSVRRYANDDGPEIREVSCCSYAYFLTPSSGSEASSVQYAPDPDAIKSLGHLLKLLKTLGASMNDVVIRY